MRVRAAERRAARRRRRRQRLLYAGGALLTVALGAATAVGLLEFADKVGVTGPVPPPVPSSLRPTVIGALPVPAGWDQVENAGTAEAAIEPPVTGQLPTGAGAPGTTLVAESAPPRAPVVPSTPARTQLARATPPRTADPEASRRIGPVPPSPPAASSSGDASAVAFRRDRARVPASAGANVPGAIEEGQSRSARDASLGVVTPDRPVGSTGAQRAPGPAESTARPADSSRSVDLTADVPRRAIGETLPAPRTSEAPALDPIRLAEPPPAARSAPPASAAPASSTTSVDPRDRVRRTIERYRSAYQQLDVAAARAVWPGVDAGALSRAFGSLSSQEVWFDACSIDVSGLSASARCSGHARVVPKVGGGAETARRTWQFSLRQAGDAWVIEKASVK